MRSALVPCLTLATVLFVACGRGIPKPPANVPEAALFVPEGGQGYFIHFENVTQLGWMVKIYDAKSGAVVQAGEFRVMGLARAEIRQSEVMRWDGQALHLKDGSQLVPWKK